MFSNVGQTETEDLKVLKKKGKKKYGAVANVINFRMSINVLNKTYSKHDVYVLTVLTPDFFDVPGDFGHQLQDDLGVDGLGGHDHVHGTPELHYRT